MVDNYTKAGVNIDAGMDFADMVKLRIAKVWPDAAEGIGGFAIGVIVIQTDRLLVSASGISWRTWSAQHANQIVRVLFL